MVRNSKSRIRKIIKFSGRDISSLAAKGLIWVTKIYSSATCGTQVIRTIKDLNSQTVYDMKRYFNQMVSPNQPNTHTTLFWHPYDIVLTLWTLYGHRNDVVCLLGGIVVFLRSLQDSLFWNNCSLLNIFRSYNKNFTLYNILYKYSKIQNLI